MKDTQLYKDIKRFLRDGSFEDTSKQLEELLNTAIQEIETETKAYELEIQKARDEDHIVALIKEYINTYYPNSKIDKYFTREYFHDLIAAFGYLDLDLITDLYCGNK